MNSHSSNAYCAGCGRQHPDRQRFPVTPAPPKLCAECTVEWGAGSKLIPAAETGGVQAPADPAPARPFRFRGFTFEPLRQLTRSEFEEGLRIMNSQVRWPNPVLHDAAAGWDYEKFYAAARRAGAAAFDLFRVKTRPGVAFLPGSNHLFYIDEA